LRRSEHPDRRAYFAGRSARRRGRPEVAAFIEWLKARPLNGEHQLADVLRALHQPVRFGHLARRERFVDHRPDPAGLDSGQIFSRRLRARVPLNSTLRAAASNR